MKGIFIYIKIIFFSIFFSLILFEIYSIKYSPDIYSYKFLDNYDFRTRFEVYDDLKKKNKNITLNLEPYHHYNEKKLFPLSSFSNRLNILCNENGFWAKYFSDRYGFRNPDYVWDIKKLDFLIIGDSFGQGYCVEDEDTIAGNLRKRGKKIINLSIGGNNQLIELASLREYMGDKIFNKVLLLYYEGNDLDGLEAVFFNNKNFIIKNYFYDDNFTQNLKFRINEQNKLLSKTLVREEKNYREIEKKRLDKEKIVTKKTDENIKKILLEKKKENKFFNILKFRKTRHALKNIKNKFNQKPNIQKTRNEQTFIIFSKLIMKIKEFVEKNNSELIFIYLPEISRYSQSTIYDGHKDYLQVLNILKTNKIKVIDIHKEIFNKSNDPLKYFPYRRFGHYNSSGYKIISELIVNKLN